MAKMTQRQRILQYMRDFGSISAYEAFMELGITQLAARLTELKNEGYRFKKTPEYRVNKYGEKVYWVRYSLQEVA